MISPIINVNVFALIILPCFCIHKNPIRVVTGDAALLPFRKGSFDIVIANDSMEHFARPAPALEEFARVTRAGGLVFLFFTPWGSPLASHLYDHIHTPWCHLLYSENLLEQLLELSLERRGDRDPAGAAARMIRCGRTRPGGTRSSPATRRPRTDCMLDPNPNRRMT